MKPNSLLNLFTLHHDSVSIPGSVCVCVCVFECLCVGCVFELNCVISVILKVIIYEKLSDTELI